MFRNYIAATIASGFLTVGIASLPSTVDAQAARPTTPPGRTPKQVPEVSVHGAPAALALALGGAAIVLGRRRRKST